jgi:hypothetical protein
MTFGGRWYNRQDMKKTSIKRAKIIEKIIRQAWSSLESHLEYTYIKTPEKEKFHKDCVKEYIDIIKNASELY